MIKVKWKFLKIEDDEIQTPPLIPPRGKYFIIDYISLVYKVEM